MKRTSSYSFDLATATFHKATKQQLDSTMSLFLVVKCPNCERLIRFSMGGTFGLGWSLRTFYCKQCKETHSISMFFKVEKGSEKPVHFTDLTQSLWRASGSRVLRIAHKQLPLGLAIENPAKLLGYSSDKLAKWLKKYVKIFHTHIVSTISEKNLHPIEVQGLTVIEYRLQYIYNVLNFFVKDTEEV
jgi:hypothetical protein